MLDRNSLHQYQKNLVEQAKTIPSLGLFLPPGLGKTATTLTIIAEQFKGKTLIVAPKRVAETVWDTEAKKWESPATPKDSQDTGEPSSTVNSAEEFFERVRSKSRELDLVTGATRDAIQQSDHRRIESLQRPLDEAFQELEKTLKELREARYPDGNT
jgi:hypothetical protein